MNTTHATTKDDDMAWDVYRQTADDVEQLIGELEFRLYEHRRAARANKHDCAWDAELREIRQHLERALEVIRW